jgi:hypothetical protein
MSEQSKVIDPPPCEQFATTATSTFFFVAAFGIITLIEQVSSG